MLPRPLASLPRNATTHFKLCYYAAVLRVLAHAQQALGSPEAVVKHFPFLDGYHDELLASGLEQLGTTAAGQWHAWLLEWETLAADHLPLRALRDEVGLGDAAVGLLLACGLVEEDARFGALFEALQGSPGQRRPMAGLLATWSPAAGSDGESLAGLRQLMQLGLVQVTNPDAPRPDWILHVPAPIWDALRGDVPSGLGPRARLPAPDRVVGLNQLVLPEAVRDALGRIPSLLAAGEVGALIIRGPQHNGRRTVLRAVAQALGRGTIELALGPAADTTWPLLGPLATLLPALPVVVLDLAPGEKLELPPLPGYTGPIGVVLGRAGAVSGASVEKALTLNLDLPGPAARREHWQLCLGPRAGEDVEAIAQQFRLTGGAIRRAAELARAEATLAGRDRIGLHDVHAATRRLGRQALETLAQPVSAGARWEQLALPADTATELRHLAARCRCRERLAASAGAALGEPLGAGVRALFTGTSGTGKTLAARVLASELRMDLYRVDLSAVVNKYIGETEKNLNQVLARAEEMNVILLLDEGDALLTQRTSVRSSNDRYANLETNFLLQRLESFDGILIVTTNAGDRIDSAFQRRMDVVIEFRPPDAQERWAIWRAHLPATHALEPAWLQTVASRCALNGGQIRNAVLHAALLALDNGGLITPGYLETAVQREYRKLGAVCPLRRAPAATPG